MYKITINQKNSVQLSVHRIQNVKYNTSLKKISHSSLQKYKTGLTLIQFNNEIKNLFMVSKRRRILVK